MIELDDHRKANLELMFAKATDRELIHELVRRGRLRQIRASIYYWPELRETDNYMDGITDMLIHHVAKNLDSDGCVARTERPDETDEGKKTKQMILTADVIVLRARDKAGE